MSRVKTFRDIRAAFENSQYSMDTACPSKVKIRPDAVIDEDQSVKWNREQIVERNEKSKADVKEWQEAMDIKREKLRMDVRGTITQTYRVTMKQAGLIESMTWGVYHSDIPEYLDRVKEYSENVRSILNAQV